MLISIISTGIESHWPERINRLSVLRCRPCCCPNERRDEYAGIGQTDGQCCVWAHFLTLSTTINCPSPSMHIPFWREYIPNNSMINDRSLTYFLGMVVHFFLGLSPSQFPISLTH